MLLEGMLGNWLLRVDLDHEEFRLSQLVRHVLTNQVLRWNHVGIVLLDRHSRDETYRVGGSGIHERSDLLKWQCLRRAQKVARSGLILIHGSVCKILQAVELFGLSIPKIRQVYNEIASRRDRWLRFNLLNAALCCEHWRANVLHSEFAN